METFVMSMDLDQRKIVYDRLKADVFEIAYMGAVDSNVLTSMAQNMEEQTIDISPQAQKKLFKSFIELAQNIALYSAERSSDDMYAGSGVIMLKEFEDHYRIYTGNVAHSSDVSKLREKIDNINKMDRAQLREYRRKMRKQADGAGGNIGLIQVALIADNPIEYKFIRMDEKFSFIIISVKIDKIAE